MSRRRKTAADQLGDGLDVRPPKQESAPEIVIVDEGTEGAITADTVSGLQGAPGLNGSSDTEIIIDDAKGASHDDGPDPFEVLKRQYNEREAELRLERQQRAQVEEHARRLSEDALAHEKGYKEAAGVALDNAIELAKSNIAAAEMAMKSALQGNDVDALIKAQTALSESVSRKAQLEQSKQQFENAPSQVQTYQPVDPIDQQISRFSPRSQEWLRKHRNDIFGDRERQIDAQAAHRLAVRRGFVPDSDEYFNAIDEQMGYTDRMTSTNRPPPQRGSTPATPAAPPSRSSFGQSPRNPNRVALTKQQRETALQLFSDKPEAEALAMYAKGILDINQGKTNLLWSKDKYRGGPGV